MPAYHSEFGLVTICLKACSTILIARESICKDRQFLSTSEEAALIIFTCKPTKVELVQIKNARQLEVMIKYTFFFEWYRPVHQEPESWSSHPSCI